MRSTHYIFVLLVLFLSCTKDNKDGDTSSTESLKLTLEKSQAVPGEAVIIKVNTKVTTQEVDILLNSTPLKGYAYGDSAYGFILPVQPSGNAVLSIPSLKGSNSLALTVGTYPAIEDPQTVIHAFVAQRNQSIDSLTKVVEGSNYQPSAESMALINQLKEEWDSQVSKLTAPEKEMLAYVLRNNRIDPAQHSFMALPAGYYARVSGIQSNIGDRLVAQAKAYVTVHNVCIGTIPVLLVSGYAFVMAPNPLTAAVFLGSFATFVISRESAIRRGKEVGKLNGIAEAVFDVDAGRIAATEFRNNTERVIEMSVAFRNLTTADNGIHADITNSFTTESTFIAKEKAVEDMYAKASAKTIKLKATYPTYKSIIGKQAPGQITLPIEGAGISIKGVSDNRISFTSLLDGNQRKVRITSTSDEEINFDLLVAYKRSLDGKELTKSIACVYKPSSDVVKIGTQTWMTKNLDVTTYRNGDPIPQVTDMNEWRNLKTGAWCYYENNAANGAKFGKLYNHAAVNDPRGLAPEGWHIPSLEEWNTLVTYLGGQSAAGGKLKATTDWSAPNVGATNSTGFTALPGGHRNLYRPLDGSKPDFDYIHLMGAWWAQNNGMFYLHNFTSNAWVESPVSRSELGFSVRCIKN